LWFEKSTRAKPVVVVDFLHLLFRMDVSLVACAIRKRFVWLGAFIIPLPERFFFLNQVAKDGFYYCSFQPQLLKT
jgi:hypothetical protein